MARINLLAVDSTLAFYPPTIPQSSVDAYKYTTTFAQAVARKADPNPDSLAYFFALRDEYARIGWNLLGADRVNYENKQRSISPADIVKEIIHPYLSGDQVAQLDGLLNAIGRGDVGVHDFTSFFWNKAHIHSDKATMSFGPLTTYLGMPSVSMIHFSWDYTEDDWRALFVQHNEASLNTQVYYLKMDLNMGLYNSIKDALIARITGHEAEHISQTAIDI